MKARYFAGKLMPDISMARCNTLGPHLRLTNCGCLPADCSQSLHTERFGDPIQNDRVEPAEWRRSDRALPTGNARNWLYLRLEI